MAPVAFHIHVDNLIVDAVNIVTLGLFLIPQRYFIATIEVYIYFFFPAPRQPPRYQQQSLTYPQGQVAFVHPGRWTILNWIAWMSIISSRYIRNNSLLHIRLLPLLGRSFEQQKQPPLIGQVYPTQGN